MFLRLIHISMSPLLVVYKLYFANIGNTNLGKQVNPNTMILSQNIEIKQRCRRRHFKGQISGILF
jgi:hypothetical protein